LAIVTVGSSRAFRDTLYYLHVVAADEPVAMDTDSVHVAVKEESDLTAQPLTSTVAMACTMPDTSVCLLGPETAMAKDTLEDVGLDLAEPFSLGNMRCFNNTKCSTFTEVRCKTFIMTTLISFSRTHRCVAVMADRVCSHPCSFRLTLFQHDIFMLHRCGLGTCSTILLLSKQ